LLATTTQISPIMPLIPVFTLWIRGHSAGFGAGGQGRASCSASRAARVDFRCASAYIAPKFPA